jgi:hypothetical protein
LRGLVPGEVVLQFLLGLGRWMCSWPAGSIATQLFDRDLVHVTREAGAAVAGSHGARVAVLADLSRTVRELDDA